MDSSGSAVVAEGLRKSYGEVRALDGFDLRVPRGTVCGLLGPNGAGKTTAVRILSTLLGTDGGRAEVAGFDVVRQAAEVRYAIGLAGQHAAVDEVLSGRQNLEMFGRLYHLGVRAARRRAEELLDQFGLAEAAGRQAKDYSGACAEGSTSRPASSWTRGCCSWTSRPPGSTRAAVTRYGSPYARSRPGAPRCS